VKGINWDQVLSGQTPFEDLSFRRKQDARDYPSTLEFGNSLRDSTPASRSICEITKIAVEVSIKEYLD